MAVSSTMMELGTPAPDLRLAEVIDDTPEQFATQKREVGSTFPYLVDTDQNVAKAYGAACTHDLFAFDGDRRLVHRGQFDPSRPGKGEADGADLRAALAAVLEGRAVPEDIAS